MKKPVDDIQMLIRKANCCQASGRCPDWKTIRLMTEAAYKLGQTHATGEVIKRKKFKDYSDAILKLIKESGKPLNIKELTALSGIDEQSVIRTVTKLRLKSKLARVKVKDERISFVLNTQDNEE